MSHDYKVRFRSKESIENLSYKLLEGENLLGSPNFSVTKLINVLTKRPLGSHGEKLTVQFYSNLPRGKKYAYVSFKPLTLHCEQEIWNEAELGEPKAREILAHELGHIMMHDHHALPYSNSGDKRLNFVRPEESAESQASHYADCLLLNRKILNPYLTVDEVMLFASVPRDLAERRLADYKVEHRPTGQSCPTCYSSDTWIEQGLIVCKHCKV